MSFIFVVVLLVEKPGGRVFFNRGSFCNKIPCTSFLYDLLGLFQKQFPDPGSP